MANPYSRREAVKTAAVGVYLGLGVALVVTHQVVRALRLPTAMTGKALDTFFGPEDGEEYESRTSPATPLPPQVQ